MLPPDWHPDGDRRKNGGAFAGGGIALFAALHESHSIRNSVTITAALFYCIPPPGKMAAGLLKKCWLLNYLTANVSKIKKSDRHLGNIGVSCLCEMFQRCK